MVGPNGRPMAALVGQQLTLLGKWLMADCYIVLCPAVSYCSVYFIKAQCEIDYGNELMLM